MKSSKLLNKGFLLTLLFYLFFGLTVQSEEEPIDIWKIDQKKNTENLDITKDSKKKM